jgi:hypothetical protein
VDYFLVLSPSTIKLPADATLLTHATKPENALFDPQITSSFPGPTDLVDMEIPESVCTFAFPLGMALSSVEKQPYFFSFVCTDLTGARLYGSSLHFFDLQDRADTVAMLGGGVDAESLAATPAWDVVYAPRAITVISHYPFFNLFREFLGQTYHVSLSSSPVPLERFVTNLVAETPLPPKGQVLVNYVCTGVHTRTIAISRPGRNQLPLVDISFRPLFGMLSVENIMVIFQSLLVEKQVCLFR